MSNITHNVDKKQEETLYALIEPYRRFESLLDEMHPEEAPAVKEDEESAEK